MGLPAGGGAVLAAVWLIKRVLQKLGVRDWRLSVTPFAGPLSASPTNPKALGAPTPSGLARRLLAGLLPEMDAISRQRQHNQQIWDDLLLNDDASREDVLSTAERPVNRKWTPYLAAYRVDLAAAEATHYRWRHQGLPVTTWPDLPPEVTVRRDKHANAWKQRHSYHYLSVHQSLRIPRRRSRGELS